MTPPLIHSLADAAGLFVSGLTACTSCGLLLRVLRADSAVWAANRRKLRQLSRAERSPDPSDPDLCVGVAVDRRPHSWVSVATLSAPSLRRALRP